MDLVVAAATMSVFITASIPARFLGGVIVDRVSTEKLRYAIASFFALQALGVTLFLFNQQSTFVLYTFFILYGIGMGAPMPMTPVMRARYFGRKHFGAIAGISRMLSVPVGVVGPVLAGWIYDKTGSYEIAFTLFAITLGMSVVLMCFVKPPKRRQMQPVF
jgi:MFS family permease